MSETSRQFSILIPILGFARSGGDRVLSKLADQWIAQQCRVSFMVPCWSELPYFPTNAEVHWVDGWGREVGHRSNKPPPSTTLGKILRFFSTLLGLLRGISKVGGPWDVVIANQSMTAWPVALGHTNASKVYYIQAYEPEHYHKKGLGILLLKGLSWMSYFLPLHRIANAPLYLCYRSCRASCWIPPGLDLENFHPRLEGGRLPQDQERPGLIVGCIGRPEPHKGTRQAIEAYRAFTSRVPGQHRFRLSNFGVPPEWLEGIPGLELVFPGNDGELADYYRSIEVLLALCTIEHGAHHYPVLEAMASGVLVITTGYTPADSSNAWIVGPDPLDAAAALVKISVEVETTERKREHALAAIRAYDWPNVGADFLKELHALREGKGHAQ